MKNILIICILLVFCTVTAGQSNNPNYDSTLAKKFGADDLGMKSYILVILKTGSANITDKAVRDSLFRGHFDNINNLAEEGKMIIAGPLEKNDKTYRGIFIFDTDSIDEVNEMLKNDPTITSKIFDVELFKWYEPAALPAYIDVYEKTWKIKP